MTRIGTMVAVAAAVAIGAMLGGGGLVQARLSTGGEVIGGAADTASEAQPAAPRAVGTCLPNRTAFRTQINRVTTTSMTSAVMSNTHYPVTHAAGCLIVVFAGEVAGSTTADGMFIRAWIQGVGAAEPPEDFLGLPVAGSRYETRSMRFVFPNVPAGTHTVRIEWRSLSGGTVFARGRTLTIQYR